MLYRAEDNSAQGIGKRTSRVGYAESKDGIEMKRLDNPVLFLLKIILKIKIGRVVVKTLVWL